MGVEVAAAVGFLVLVLPGSSLSDVEMGEMLQIENLPTCTYR